MLTDGPVPKPAATRSAAVRFLRPGPGRLQSVAGLAEASTAPGVVEVSFPHEPGDVLTARDAGFVLAAGAPPGRMPWCRWGELVRPGRWPEPRGAAERSAARGAAPCPPGSWECGRGR
ncbi:hypothetical protein [Lentzea sp. NPDC060358]|uniref:hypothetical protein n=1 Tax=Lentzea sp. NPDC060358 TaxID=3347103 RepID=UPI00364A1B6A